MAAAAQLQQPDEVASKVLRRAQVSKMTRALQDRLALANVKIQNGWENLSLDAMELKVEERLHRKRPLSSNDTMSDTASTTSSRMHSSSGLASSPLTEPLFSDDMLRSGGSLRVKRPRPARPVVSRVASSGDRKGRLSNRSVSWKRDYELAQSSPIKPTKHARFPSTNLSFISEGSTVANDPPSPEFSEDDDADLPVTSFSVTSSTRITTTSPPHTPPPDRRMRKRSQNVAWSRTPRTGEEGADLLMFLATSPSPATAGHGGDTVTKPVLQAPSTPPSKPTPLPSSHMTPGMTGQGFLGFGPNTPSTNFNFADFVNVTPSPAQGSWNRTPVAGRTPGASARRKLNFDTLMPPNPSSPMLSRNGSRAEGLGMELGGELIS